MYQQRPAQVLASLPEGPDGIRETLKLMRDLVRAQKSAPSIRDKAVNVTFYIPRNAWIAKARSLWSWVKANIKYIPDIRNVETIHWPTQVLSQGFGDCDDQAALLAAMLESIGMPTRFVAVGFTPGSFSHVYSEVYIGNDWIPLETTEDEPWGWKPPGIVTAYILRN
jgi:transglutaminase-like putative cysteine protease